MEIKIKLLITRNMYRHLIKFLGLRQNVFSELKISKKITNCEVMDRRLDPTIQLYNTIKL